MKVDISTTILAIDPTAWVGVSSGDINKITWHDGNPNKITNAQILAKREELQAAEPIRLLRIDRDRLLASSDWTGLADTALTNEKLAEWKLYRQKLRDLPKGLTTPFKVKNAVWPTKP
tara:strand:+ start:465 stop:818 length:354 start_codon:yes stop_codon:yes gene_type:complete